MLPLLLPSLLFALAALARPSAEVNRLHIRETGFKRQVAGNTIIPVVVGGPQDTFLPNIVTAAVGDVIQFQFSNGNHTVTQSAADAPCQALQKTVATAIHSGHIPFQDGQTTVGTFNMPVVNTEPMFLFCATGPHCQEGQVMVINPSSDQQVTNYAKLAAQAAATTDGTTVIGGTVGQIPLTAAAFTPAPADAGGAPAAPAAPVAEAPPAAVAPGAGTAATTTLTGTTTIVVTVIPGATAVIAGAAAAGLAG